ncbi:hypothetical protein VJY32_04425 [Ignavibacteria bacterium 4148-Me]|uniref:hypothetical protein n=1 Tax=Rosettibacter primus TaxID=3111523 RepID=UPI00336C0925
MRRVAFLISVVIIVLINSCGEGITEPQPGRRDYVWTVDTINPGNESLYLGRIWGSSPNDVWAVGTSSWSATSIWHYDGVKWKTDSIPRKVNPQAIFGLSSSEVWLGNYNSTIWKYDGLQWSLFGEYKIDGYNILNINNFDGMSSSNIYGVGFVELYGANKWKAIIMHYNGIYWSLIDIPETKVSFETIAVEPNSGILVISGTVYDPNGFIAKVYCWDGKELKELLSDYGWSFVIRLGDEIFVTNASRIYKYSNKNLTFWKDNNGTGINGNIICGRSRNDFFIGGINGIYHYDGKEFKIIYETNLTVQRGITFDKDVFFIGTDYINGKNNIIHGQLK